MSYTSTKQAIELAAKTTLPRWWFDVALGSLHLGHKAQTASEALHFFDRAPADSIEKAAAYKRYSELAKVHEDDVNDLWIRHWAFYKDFYVRMAATKTVDEAVQMLKEPGVVAGSPLWDDGLQRIICLASLVPA